MITHITVEDAANLISRIARINETHALTYIREAADRGEIQTADVAPVAHAQWKDDTCTNCGYGVQPWNNTGYCPSCGARMDKEVNT